MKFSCDNCHAKYQIPDEKVAGKTMRMRCRKCDHLIEVHVGIAELTGQHAQQPQGGPRVTPAGAPPGRPQPGTGPTRPSAPTFPVKGSSPPVATVNPGPV